MVTQITPWWSYDEVLYGLCHNQHPQYWLQDPDHCQHFFWKLSQLPEAQIQAYLEQFNLRLVLYNHKPHHAHADELLDKLQFIARTSKFQQFQQCLKALDARLVVEPVQPGNLKTNNNQLAAGLNRKFLL